MAKLGVEYGTIYRLTGPDGTSVVFNNSASSDFVGILNPEETSGLDSPDVREDASDAIEMDGGVHGDFFYGRRPIVLAGFIIASSPTDRNEKAAKIKAACNAMRQNAILQWKPLGATEEVYVEVRLQQPLRIVGNYQKKFQIPLVSAETTAKGVSNKSAEIASTTKFQSKIAGSSTGIHWGAFGEEEENKLENFGALTANDNIYVKIEPTSDPTKMVSSTGSNYGFTIPGTAKIKGIEVLTGRKASAAGSLIKDWRVRLVSNEVSESIKLGENKANTAVHWTNAEVTVSYGSYKDLWGWGGTLTPTLVNTAGANGFGTVIMPQRGTSWVAGAKGEIDYHQMLVYYEEAAPANTTSITPTGSEPSYPILTLTGPVENPVIENTTTGQKIVLNYSLAAGSTLVIDTKNSTVRVNGTTNVYNTFDFASSEWWNLVPGANVIKFTAASMGTTANLKIEYRNNWF